MTFTQKKNRGFIQRALVSAVALLAVAACVGSQDAVQKEVSPEIDPAEPVVATGGTEGTEGFRSTIQGDKQQQLIAVYPRVEDEKYALEILADMPSKQAAPVVMAAPSPQQFIQEMKSGRARGMAVVSEMQREKYAHYDKNPVNSVQENPVSTFSVDVDTGSYSLVRNRLNQGSLPHPDAVRAEELINYFSYDYRQPKGDVPFSVTTDAFVTPWNKNTYLLRVGLQGKKIIEEKRPAANLVFLLDVSGSMRAPDKLPLLIKSLQFMARQLRDDDTISIVVYAGAAGIVLDAAKGTETAKIRNALAGLQAGGSTAGGAGIRLAYAKARESFIEGGINRILIATDGDFNMGVSNVDELKAIIEANRESGVSLTTLGFGDGNYNDHLMEQIADVGNGNYAYVDNFREAKKILGDQLSATLYTIAKDVKIQVEFNPALVAEYRLIGYENRTLADEDFANDKVDAGEIGAGHSVTALYEIALVGSKGLRLPIKRYESEMNLNSAKADELAYVKLRYKAPGEGASRLVSHVVPRQVLKKRDLVPDLVHVAAVAAYGQLLADSKYMGDFGFKDILALLQRSKAPTEQSRAEFVELVESAAILKELNAVGR